MITTRTAGLTRRRRSTTFAAAFVLMMLAGSCGDDDSADTADSDPAQVIEDYRIAYNGGDIDEVMEFFSDESVMTDHPFASEAAGLAAIRSLNIRDMGSAATEDAYSISNVAVSGDTVTWDHVWINDAGENWCGEGNNAEIGNGQILTFTFAPNPHPCA